MTYQEQQRLADIQAAIDAIRSHLQRGDLSDGLVFDAVRIRLLEIGEAVKALPAGMLSSQPNIPWSQIARMRDHLAHRYFDTNHAILRATVDNDLPELERAVQALAAMRSTHFTHQYPRRPGATRRSGKPWPADSDRTGLGYERVRTAIGNGLATAAQQDHRRQRLVMQPAFRHEHLRGYVAVMRQEITAAMANWPDGEVIDLVGEMFTLTTTVARGLCFPRSSAPNRPTGSAGPSTSSCGASTRGRRSGWRAGCLLPAIGATPGPHDQLPHRGGYAGLVHNRVMPGGGTAGSPPAAGDGAAG